MAPSRDSVATTTATTATTPTAASAAPARPVPPHARVPEGLQVAAGYGWRLIVVAAAVYLTFAAAARLTFVAVAVFVGLVITALLRPVVDLASRVVPRGLAVPAALLLTRPGPVGGCHPIPTAVAIRARPSGRSGRHAGSGLRW